MSGFSSELIAPLAQDVLRSQKVFMQPEESLTDYPRLRFGGCDFYVDIETGFDPEGPYDLEPDTVLIDYVHSKKEGKGLATAALSNILVQARALEYRYARMAITAPKMVHIAQKLVELEYASLAGFEVYSLNNPLSKSTQLIAASRDLNADQAYDFLKDMIASTAEKFGENWQDFVDMPVHVRCGLEL